MNKHNKSIAIWIFSLCLIIFLMVAIGGLTRLTESGLSIVKWKPVHGIVPPLNEADWNAEFDSYKQSPEYMKKNKGMELSRFKFIFWWEYIHRLIGRLLGVAFIVPFVYFSARRYFSFKEAVQLLIIFSLGGLQGFVGWWMVKSGLVNDPAVSHFRLATHLSIALLIFSLLLAKGLKFYLPDLQNKKHAGRRANKFANILIFVIAVQIIFGAFTAGLDAGLVYNTWPLMNGEFLPSIVKFNLSNLEFIQFFHRWWAFVVLATAIYFSRMQRKGKLIFSSKQAYTRVRKANKTIHALIGTQIILGILNLIYQVPVPLASLHQMVAVIILVTAVYIRRVI